MKLMFLLIGLILISGCVAQESPNLEEPPQSIEEKPIEEPAVPTEQPSPEEQIEPATDTMTFIVTVPENTPDGDIINIIYDIPTPNSRYPSETVEMPMEKVSDYTYQITLTREDMALDKWGTDTFTYIYNRNAWGDITTEYLPLKPEDREPGNPFEYRNARRKVDFEPGKIQRDAVTRWRWFPEGPVKYTSDIEPEGEFLPRVNDIEFRSGEGIQDLYIRGFEKFYNSTAEHMVTFGYAWVAFYPPWQWIDDDPPKVGNALELGLTDGPNYLSDESLKEQIKEYKAKGLKVSLEPQICCNSINTEGRSVPWWNSYVNEVERFTVHHAKIAEEVGADMFLIGEFGIDREKVPNYNKRMEEMVAAVREVYSGEIGVQVSPFLWQVDKPQSTIPAVDDIPWASKVDFIYYDAEGEFSPKENPTDEELKEGAGHILDIAKPFYDKYRTPLVVTTAEASVKQAWRGPSFLQKGKIPGESGAEDEWEFHSYSAEDQARVVNAYWRAIAERPWVIGYFHFGYWQWEMPMLPDWSIRGKPAEDLWRKWNKAIYQQ